MKKTYITLSFMLATMALSAQNKDTEKADRLYEQMNYSDAAGAYLKVNKKDAYVYKQLGDSYYNLFNTKEAARWYAKAVESKQDAETYYRYAQMLKAEGNYEEANKQMHTFATMAPDDTRAVTFMKDPDYLPKLRSQTKLFDEKLLDISDKKYSDFGAVLTDDNTLYFTSTRNTARRTYGRNEEPYLDIYRATYNDNGTISEPQPVSELNSKWHDGPAAVTADGNTMYFASESFKEGESEKGKGQRNSVIYLFKATKENGKWGNIKALPFNDKNWSTGNPAISKDGKTLYFASNRKGSMGGADIWKVDVKGNDSYGQPVNLGKKINTEGNENFPYVTDDNKLFFASDGRKGFGAYDVFMIDLNDKNAEAQNLGAPINSEKDDFSFSFNKTHNIGFFSSNREGEDNLYLAIPVCGVDAAVTVKDSKTGKTLAAAKVAIMDDRGNVIETRQTDENGEVTYSVDCNKPYFIKASADGHLSGTVQIPKTNGGDVDVTANLDPVENLIVDGKVMLNDIYFDYDKSSITERATAELDKLVEVMKAHPTMVIMVKAHTDSRGSDEYNMELSERRAQATVQYVISQGIDKSRISGKGYGESDPKIKCTDCTEEEYAENRRTEFIIVKE